MYDSISSTNISWRRKKQDGGTWRYRFSNVSRGFSGYHKMCWFFLLRGEQVANPYIIYVLDYHADGWMPDRQASDGWMYLKITKKDINWHKVTLSWRLIMKYFLRSFSPFRWFKKGSCQFLAKECAQYWLTA